MKNYPFTVTKLSFTVVVLCFLFSCQGDNQNHSTETTTAKRFNKIPSNQCNVTFKNTITEDVNLNFVRFPYIYNGGGVSVGDINNDGLDDLYFTSNQGSNKLYLNEGKMQFKDITLSAGVADNKGWSTGTTMVDINNDGWLDIYVCKSGLQENNEDRKNKLFINQKNGSFKELARDYGLDDPAYSTQSYFFDYDKDGDLDCYIVNHRNDFTNTIVINPEKDSRFESLTSDKLYQNNNGKFTDVSEASGITNNSWGLSASIGDFNDDSWPDIYVCNDFVIGDQLWINKGDGTFKNGVLETMDHTSFFSMGSDWADINNDNRPDLLTLDMVSEDHVANKKNMAAMGTDQFRQLVELGNHYQYMSNMLHINRGKGVFSETGLAHGISNTDWSWAPLIADLDNDGLKDIFVTNGIKRDMTDNDYKINIKKRAAQGRMTIDEAFRLAPSRKIKNYCFKNTNGGKFEKVIEKWGFGQFLNSNGSAYSDLDNDGDLDLILNNLDDYASIYKNNTDNNFLKIKLKGPQQNVHGIGTQITVSSPSGTQYIEQYISRGFQSSVSPILNLGLGNNKNIDKVSVVWPDGKIQELKSVKSNQILELDYKNAQNPNQIEKNKKTIFNKTKSILDFVHKENAYDDFEKEILLPQKYSTLGPGFDSGDLNGDGLDDMFIGGAKGQVSQILIQKKNGQFSNKNTNLLRSFKNQESIGTHFFDADNDGDLDIYIAHGGNEVKANANFYTDRLLLNDGKGNFSLSKNIPTIKSSTQNITSGDFDNDGDLDLFVGGRLIPGQYPFPANSYLLQNNNGKFVDVSAQATSGLNELGLVTDAEFSDYDNDGDLDLLIIGEWMPLTIFNNDNGKLTRLEDNLTDSGWWFSIKGSDLDNDGDTDYVLGNLGLNNKFGAKKEQPFHVFCNDFDESGSFDIVLSKEKGSKFLPVRGRECSSQQMPFIKEKFPTYKSFAEADLFSIYGEEKLNEGVHYSVSSFESIILINNGDGSFIKKKMPFECQWGPLLDIEVWDVNKDGHQDIVAAGNIYNAEVETIRYDSMKGIVLLGDGNGNFRYEENSGLLSNGDIKQIEKMKINNENFLILASNNGVAEMFKSE